MPEYIQDIFSKPRCKIQLDKAEKIRYNKAMIGFKKNTVHYLKKYFDNISIKTRIETGVSKILQVFRGCLNSHSIKTRIETKIRKEKL